VILKTAFGLADSQDSDIRDMINIDNIDVLIIVPVDATKSAKMAEFAKSKGVGVIAYSRPIPSEAIDFHIRFDVPEIGANQAKYLVEKQPVGNYLIIHGPTTDLNTAYLLKGQMDVLKKYSGIKILDTAFLDGWTRMKASQVMKGLLNIHGNEVTAVLAANDMIAEAAHDVLYEMDKNNVLITGLDAEVKACQRILNEHQTMTVLLPPNDIAKCVGSTALYLASKDNKYISEYNVIEDNIGEENIKSKCINVHSIVLDKINVRSLVELHKVFPVGWLK
jgi:D-xylose transport system substrate-binding protein